MKHTDLKRAVKNTASVLAALLLMGMLTGCFGPMGPKPNKPIQSQTVTITVKGDTNVTVTEPKTIEVLKGSKWGAVKAKVLEKVGYTTGYKGAGFKLDNESGIYLKDDYSFTENQTVFALSKQQGTPGPEKLTITVKGDANVTVNEPKTIEVSKGAKWSDIKTNVNVSYKTGYEAAGFKLESESGIDLNDEYIFNENKTVFAISKQQGTVPEKITITIKGDAHVTVNEPKTIEVSKGSKWSDIKAKVEEKVSYTIGYEGAGFKFDSASGIDLKSDDVFNESKTVFALSKASIFITDRKGTITGFNSGLLPAKLVIPSKIGNEVITKIGDNAFSGCTNLRELELPDTLTEIGYSAFKNCPIETLVINCNITNSMIHRLTQTEEVTNNLINLIIGEGVKKIGAPIPQNSFDPQLPIFRPGNKLKNVKLPESLTLIGWGAFSGCSKLVEINFPPNLEGIEGDYFFGAFSRCSKLAAVDLSACTKLTEIGKEAFGNCEALKGIDLSPCKNLGKIEFGAFQGCTSLEQITLPENITVICMDAFKECKSLTKLDLSLYTKLDRIEKGAFGDCTGLTELRLPQSLTGIGVVYGGYTNDGYGAFINCTGLTSIDLSGCANLGVIDEGSFSGCKNAEIKLPENIYTIRKNAFGYKYNTESLCKKVLIKSGNNFEKLKNQVIDSDYDENRIESY